MTPTLKPLTGFGQTGSYAELAGHDLSYLAHSGLRAAIEGLFAQGIT